MALTKVSGTNGNDTFVATVGGFHYVGNNGSDTVDFSGAGIGVSVDLRNGAAQDVGFGGGDSRDQFSSIENLMGTQFADTLIGRDTLGGTLNGGDGDDSLYAGSAGNLNAFTLIGGNGNDHLEGRLGNDTLDGGAGIDGMQGGGGNDILNGGADNDSMLGGDGNDQLVGGFGADRMGGGAGADTFAFAAGDNGLRSAGQNDTVTDFAQGTDHIQLAAGATWTQGFVGTLATSNSLLDITYADSSHGQVAFTSRIIFNNSDFV